MNKKRKIYYKGMDSDPLNIFSSNKDRCVPKSERKRDFYKKSFESHFKKDSPRDLIVMYDIPSEKKGERDWFRRQLINFGYTMIQKSVWVGPSPLPAEFVKYVKKIGLENSLISFKLEKPYKNKKMGL